ncbi:MAG: NYN domain-containing protein [bacterium]|nr:NYN domain-containing protein [bacterium]
MKSLKKIERFVNVKEKKLKYMVSARQLIKKGDVDVEIVLDIVRNIERLDAVFVISGDSDFLELRNYIVKDKKKMIVFVGYEENMAWELRQCWHIYLNRIKDEIVLAIQP